MTTLNAKYNSHQFLIYHADALFICMNTSTNYVSLIITSPPRLPTSYFLDIYIEFMRIVKSDGKMWLNMGEFYGPAIVDVVEKIILNSTQRHDIVFDPFFGSGLVIDLCRKHHRRFIGGDIDDEKVELQVLNAKQ